ncbi:E3 ubiquitin-protein ligase [Apostasia shenzhenica]|uniref:E3 ubiquitin-protein ligase n=1 Tax=Apostasia shenzhenica TaxID=1088818 RepID=A0A2I0AFZ1_9ASPA|nr:E3 ubiquitin-protein ligase [Apostasia shenzhenica]
MNSSRRINSYEIPTTMAFSGDGGQPESRAPPLGFLMRMAVRVSRARWFGFLRRVFRYQNGSRSDFGSNPLNSKPWILLELFALVGQIIAVAAVLAVSITESPVWPLRAWVSSYNIANVICLLLLYWRYRCWSSGHGGNGSNGGHGFSSEVEQQRSPEESRTSHLMNKTRKYLELFYALWFVMGNVWVFDSRLSSFSGAPKLHLLCLLLLAWNAALYSFPFLLFLLLCCVVPLLSRLLGYNMSSASAGQGASDDQISRLRHWRFEEAETLEEIGERNSVSFSSTV